MMEQNIQELFLKLLNMSIAAGWMILALIILRLFFRKVPRTTWCVLWGLVALRLVCPVSIESIFSLIPSAETIPEEILLAREPAIQSGISALNTYVNPVISQWLTPKYEAIAVNPAQIITLVCAGIWMIGVIGMLSYTVISYVRLYRRTKESIPYKPSDRINSGHHVPDRLHTTSDMTYGLEQAVVSKDTKKIYNNIWMCDHIAAPFILGIIKPRIFLPSQVDKADIEYIIAHERAHLKRRDHWWKPIGFALLTIYWFHPLMWVAYILLCRDIEFACDEQVIKEMGSENKKFYLETLIHCSASPKMISACPLAFGEVGVEKRIKNVLHYKKPAFWITVAAILICIVVVVCFLTNPAKKGNEPDLSFLNVENAISFVADQEEVMAIHYPIADKNGDGMILLGAVYGKDLAVYLDGLKWKECNAPSERLPSPGSVDFIIDEDLRISIYKRKAWDLYPYAIVKYGEEKRYYKAGRQDYEEAVAMLHSANGVAKEETGTEIIAPIYNAATALETSEIIYVCKDSPEPLLPRITLNLEEQSAAFSYALFSSQMYPTGTFEITDTELILTTDGGVSIEEKSEPIWKYVFTREGDCYIFDADRSSVMPQYRYSAGGELESPVSDGAVFEPIMLRLSAGEAAPMVIDSIMADVDYDGVDEICTLTYGRTSGLFTFELSVKEYGKDEPEYHSVYNSKFYYLSFLVDGTGQFYVQGITQDEAPETHLFRMEFEQDGIALVRDTTGEKLDRLE